MFSAKNAIFPDFFGKMAFFYRFFVFVAPGKAVY